jgi:hypothetical protein
LSHFGGYELRQCCNDIDNIGTGFHHISAF